MPEFSAISMQERVVVHMVFVIIGPLYRAGFHARCRRSLIFLIIVIRFYLNDWMFELEVE
jgi:hypothetical protein